MRSYHQILHFALVLLHQGNNLLREALKLGVRKTTKGDGRKQALLVLGAHNGGVLLTEALVLRGILVKRKLDKELSRGIHRLEQIYDQLL